MQSTITGARYVLAVNDLEKSAEYYQQQLGCTLCWNTGGWCMLMRGKFIVMLGECPDEKPASEINDHSYFAYVDVENINDLYVEYRAKGVKILSDIEDQPWEQREFAITTIDGHRIRFGEGITQ